MKRLYINNTVHQQLKRDARAQGVTLQHLTEQRLCNSTPVTPYKPLQEYTTTDDSQEYTEPTHSPLDALINSGLIKRGI